MNRDDLCGGPSMTPPGYYDLPEQDEVELQLKPREWWDKLTGRDKQPDRQICQTCGSYINPDGICDGDHSDYEDD